ncbi:hypothetical protein CEP88_11640 [Roseobacter denitrificans]|uniref:Transposase, putative n=1 Tax=Roseobacter denitrificans (strain ATCC 33942 / OCh 114) TaxID=375451 RepID=Q16DF5_ROSDO|nr:hypothetical protein [Roseobacter denitrificans]ABG29988.1 transposase, putative [Roseobacter denitrificans OCh 114]AVL53196.1 hypothetical protein CEP88_11640 [Roseobacter denitrificans]SFG39509.1 transposase [Roseobacter denitrificans OCh 114]
MGTSIYSDDFTRDAVHGITVRGNPVWEASELLTDSAHSPFKWISRFGETVRQAISIEQQAMNRHLQRELAGVTR